MYCPHYIKMNSNENLLTAYEYEFVLGWFWAPQPSPYNNAAPKRNLVKETAEKPPHHFVL